MDSILKKEKIDTADLINQMIDLLIKLLKEFNFVRDDWFLYINLTFRYG